uniref:Uncharacterized protein n=1 Tax=Marseillevirus sp. TaxID=2809551 RepID=A0AA96J172_9VIRU|nr:hypothetical protein MarDSR_438 [Marseillevirus sp.]
MPFCVCCGMWADSPCFSQSKEKVVVFCGRGCQEKDLIEYDGHTGLPIKYFTD